MLDVTGINKFNYDPRAEETVKDAKAREVSTEDAEATPTVQDPNPAVDPQGGN